MDDWGKLKARWSLSAWGKVESGTAALANRFPGQFADEETGLVYNFHRYYDPQIGRFISPDPMGIAPSLNVYEYPADPVNFADPFGLRPHHQCSVSLQDSNGTRHVPTSDSGRRGPGGQPIPGSQSGYRDNGSPRGIAGAQGSDGNTRDTDQEIPQAHQNQTLGHSEQHAMDWAEHHFSDEELAGSHMNLGGQNPPCHNCHQRMREFSEQHGSTVHYNWPVNNRVEYRGGQGPTAVSHGGHAIGDEARRLQDAHAAGGNRAYREEYTRQNQARTVGGRIYNSDGSLNENPTQQQRQAHDERARQLGDRTNHRDDNEDFERTGPGQSPDWSRTE